MIPARNLTQVDAIERASLITVESYDITLDLSQTPASGGERSFLSTSTVRFTCTAPDAATTIDAAAERILSATLNSVPIDVAGWASDRGLPLTGLAESNELIVTAEFGYVGGGRGMHRSVDPADEHVYLYTSFEPAAAQFVFACFDQPDLKATFTFDVRVPSGWRVISNMPVIGEDTAAGYSTVHCATSPRMSTYLAAVCAGPFAQVRSTDGGRDLGIFCRPELVEHLDADVVFDLTRRGMDFYEAQFGQPYPLPKYDQVAVPEYGGAMENFGCIVFAENGLIFRSTPTEADLTRRASTILHELAHMWFGDLVTMRWWDDLWLNEAFATWASFWCLDQATDVTEPWARFAVALKAEGVRADQLTTTHPVYTDTPDVFTTEMNFDAITYCKGASVLKQLAEYVGIDAFTAGLRAYFAEHQWANATFDDLVDALAVASGLEVGQFAAQWLRTVAINTLRPEVGLDSDGGYRSIAILQEAPPAHPTLRTHRLAVGLYDLCDDRLIRRAGIDLVVSGPRTELPELPGGPAADLIVVNDVDQTFAKIRFDQRSLSTVLTHVGGIDSALTRAICWAAVSDMVSDAELPARELVRMVHNGLSGETDNGLVSVILEDAVRALVYFTDPAWIDDGWASLADVALTAVGSVKPGSSLQLIWARAFASAARTPQNLAIIRGWLDSTAPAGLVVDADLRWLLLRSLVAGGAAGEDEIEALAQEDRSVSGRREAAMARALMPTAAAKEAAWQVAVAGTDQSTEVRRAALAGYGHSGHIGLTGSHVSDYLDTVDEIWRTQGDEWGRMFAVLAFPSVHVSPETVGSVQQWLDAGGHQPSQVRYVEEGRDRMVRALAARSRDAQR